MKGYLDLTKGSKPFKRSLVTSLILMYHSQTVGFLTFPLEGLEYTRELSPRTRSVYCHKSLTLCYNNNIIYSIVVFLPSGGGCRILSRAHLRSLFRMTVDANTVRLVGSPDSAVLFRCRLRRSPCGCQNHMTEAEGVVTVVCSPMPCDLFLRASELLFNDADVLLQ